MNKTLSDIQRSIEKEIKPDIENYRKATLLLSKEAFIHGHTWEETFQYIQEWFIDELDLGKGKHGAIDRLLIMRIVVKTYYKTNKLDRPDLYDMIDIVKQKIKAKYMSPSLGYNLFSGLIHYSDRIDVAKEWAREAIKYGYTWDKVSSFLFSWLLYPGNTEIDIEKKEEEPLRAEIKKAVEEVYRDEYNFTIEEEEEEEDWEAFNQE